MHAIPVELATGINRAVLTHVDGKSAHSDVGEALIAAIKPLGDVQLFCPDWAQYRYVVASTKSVIFGIALGTDTLAFRLDDRMKGRALATGAALYSACGPDWVSFIPFRSDWPKVDFDFWALKAYGYCREIKL